MPRQYGRKMLCRSVNWALSRETCYLPLEGADEVDDEAPSVSICSVVWPSAFAIAIYAFLYDNGDLLK
jgi:hypothetical protein